MKEKELKRELSKLVGIDFFNPKYRDVFKKYFPDDAQEDADEEISNEDNKVAENKVDDGKVEEIVQDIDKAEDEREIDKIEEDKADTEDKAEEKAEEKTDESKEISKDVDELKDDKTSELLDAKIELELVKAGVKPEKINSAKKMAKYEVANLDELDKIKDLIKEYPEWVRGYKAENFGMAVDEDNDNLTEEQKRLRDMGINPR